MRTDGHRLRAAPAANDPALIGASRAQQIEEAVAALHQLTFNADELG
ncbi:MAG: hypothetical protein WAZ19_13935 [Anaerolineae bacterium]